MTLQMNALLAIVVGIGSWLAVQGQTIPELATLRGGKPVTSETVTHPPRKALQELSKEADLVVIGKLVNPLSYMTPDQRDIYTDYQLQLTAAVVDRASIASARQVGQLPPVTVTLHGGTILVNGVAVTFKDTSPTQWDTNADLLLFLRRSDRKDKQNNFVLVGSAAGLFEVTQKGLKSRIAGGFVHEEIDGASVDQIVQRVKSLSSDPNVRK